MPRPLPAAVALLGVMAACAPRAADARVRWKQSNVVVLRANDDVLGGASSQLTWLDEVNPATRAVESTFGPLQGSGPNARWATLSVTWPRDGWIQRSADRRFLTFMAMVRHDEG